MQNLMLRLGMEEDVPIESRLISKRIAKAQEAVEMQNFEARKHLLEYDDVNNKQRQAVYGMRRQLLEGIDQKERVMEMVRGIVEQYHRLALPQDKHPDTWDIAALRTDVLSQFGYRSAPECHRLAEPPGSLRITFSTASREKYDEKEETGRRRDDALHRAHRHAPGHRQPVERPPAVDGRAEAGHQPAGARAEGPAGRVQEGILRAVRRDDGPHRGRNRPLPVLPPGAHGCAPVLPFPEDGRAASAGRGSAEARAAEQKRLAAQSTMEDFTRNIQRKKDKEMEQLQLPAATAPSAPNRVLAGKKVGRNEKCPCGSGKKYKHCHGA